MDVYAREPQHLYPREPQHQYTREPQHYGRVCQRTTTLWTCIPENHNTCIPENHNTSIPENHNTMDVYASEQQQSV